MIKKSFIGALATMLCLGSCSDDTKSGLLPVLRERVPMFFSVSQEPLTRLSYIERVDDLEMFHLASQVEGVPYLQCSCYKGDADGVFNVEASEPMLWPGDDRKVVDFYAMNEMEIFPFLFWDDSTGDPAAIQNHEARLSAWALGNGHDIVAAYASMRCPEDGQVKLTFKHVMAELEVDVRGEEAPNARYLVTNVLLTGDSERIYHFDTNTWTDASGAVEYYEYDYFDYPNGYSVGFDYDNLQVPGNIDSPNVFLIPGTYTIKVTYRIGNDTHGNTAKVTLLQGRKNTVRITLPYVPGAM